MSSKEGIAALQAQVRQLAADEVYESALLLGSFVVSLSRAASRAAGHASVLASAGIAAPVAASKAGGSGPAGAGTGGAVDGSFPLVGDGSLLESLLVFADVLRAKGETKRAVDYYKKALAERKAVRPVLQSRRRGQSGKWDPARLRADEERLSKMGADIRFAVARCQARLGQKQSAIKTMDAINEAHRTPSMLLWTGQLYLACGMENQTVSSYEAAVRRAPYALGAVRSLLRLGVGAADVADTVVAGAAPEDAGWLRLFVQAHGAASMNQHRPALEALTALGRAAPENAHVLTSMAEEQLELKLEEAAVGSFQQARAADAKSLEGMDLYASVVRRHKDGVRLNALSRQLVDVDDARPEPWMSVALFCDLNGDAMSALQFVCKALELDPLHVPAHHFKGALQLRMNQPALAVTAFYKAYSLRRTFAAYKGLVDSYLAIPKVSEALRTAKEALQLMPKDARAVLLVGRVLAHTSSDGRKKASKAYAKALKLDPRCHEAAVAFADLYLQHAQEARDADPDAAVDVQPAIAVVRETLQHGEDGALHVKLGDLHAAEAQFDMALAEYHKALSLDQGMPEAKVGIERLEKLMRGQDQDEDGDYELDNDGDGYSD